MKKWAIFNFVMLVGFVFLFSPLIFNTRPLSETEINVLSPLYMSSVELQKIRIKYGGPLTWVFPGVTIGSTISFPKQAYDEQDRKDQALLVHEVCHVWQYQNFGIRYIPRSLWELLTQRDAYVIHYEASKSFRDYDVEEQCEIMAEFFLNGDAKYAPYVEEAKRYRETSKNPM